MMKNLQEKESELQKEDKKLFREFPAPSFNEWKQAAVKTLKGASFEEKLVTNTYEGIAVQPMYTQESIKGISHLSSEPSAAPYLRGTKGFGETWGISQELPYGLASKFNEAAKKDLNRGQTMLNLVLDSASSIGLDPDHALSKDVGDKGVSISSIQDIQVALEGIDLETTPFFVQAGISGLSVYSMIVGHLMKSGTDTRKLRGCVGMDPLGTLAKEGALPFSIAKAYDLMAKVTVWAKLETPEVKTILIQGDSYHSAGGNAVQELAFTLASAVEYLRELQARRLMVQEISKRMAFTFSIGSNVFMEIAKLRAARLLWSKIIAAFGGSEEDQKMFIHARTSSWTKTAYDPYVNMLRSTAEAFTAVVGGADSLHVSAFDEPLRTPDEFSRRIARNTQLILDKESHLSKVADPAGGSWYVEALTDSIAKHAWELFQQIESVGGMSQALQKGMVQDQIKQVADQKFTDIVKRKKTIVGTNMFPNVKEQKLPNDEGTESFYETRCADVRSYRESTDSNKKETLLEQLRAAKEANSENFLMVFRHGATLGEVTRAIRQADFDAEVPTIMALPVHRASEPFEALRKNAETYKEKMGSFPKVFLANMGELARHKQRADFAAGFFEVGGFEVISNNGFKTIDQAVEAALDSRASIVVICTNDPLYPEVVPSLTQELKKYKPDLTLFVAGQPSSDQVQGFKQAGVDDFITVQSNCYQVLLNLQQQKGIGQ